MLYCSFNKLKNLVHHISRNTMTFFNVCNCAYNITTQQQKASGYSYPESAKINSRKPSLGLKHLLSLFWKEILSPMQDLQRHKHLPSEYE